jgi:hypothetical protein
VKALPWSTAVGGVYKQRDSQKLGSWVGNNVPEGGHFRLSAPPSLQVRAQFRPCVGSAKPRRPSYKHYPETIFDRIDLASPLESML